MPKTEILSKLKITVIKKLDWATFREYYLLLQPNKGLVIVRNFSTEKKIY